MDTIQFVAEKLGVAAVVAKPYDFDALLPLVEHLLSDTSRTATAVTAPLTAPGQPQRSGQ
jgi:hypothetical protein